MWNCRQVEERAGDLLDRRLRMGERFGLWAHLAVCPDCRAWLRQMRATVAMLRALPPEPPAPETEARLREAFRARRPG